MNLVDVALLSLPLSLAACHPHPPDRPELLPGVYIAYVQPQGCTGCDELGRGDVIRSIDGAAVRTTKDFLAKNITDGEPHEIVFLDRSNGNVVTTIEIIAKPNDSMPPLEDAPPFWTVGSEDLEEAPDWARRRLFGHASPKLLFVGIDGVAIDGRDLYGRKILMVMFDWVTGTDRLNGALSLQVLQKAQADLAAKNVEIIFAQIKHPAERDIAPMNEADLRAFFEANQVPENEGGPLLPPPLYRMPNKTEEYPPHPLGLEGELSYREELGEPPNIFVLDEHGIIRWHSAGAVQDPSGALSVDMVYTINEAVLFALYRL